MELKQEPPETETGTASWRFNNAPADVILRPADKIDFLRSQEHPLARVQVPRDPVRHDRVCQNRVCGSTSCIRSGRRQRDPGLPSVILLPGA